MSFIAKGPEAALTAFVAELKRLNADIEATQPIVSMASPGSRRPLGLDPLMEVAISLATGVASNVLYDLIKIALTKIRDSRAITVKEKDSPNAEDTKRT